MTSSRSWASPKQHQGQVRDDVPVVSTHVKSFVVAEPGKTVFFSSPLYRKNLHYKVIPKPQKENDHLDMMVSYILENYPNASGIVYCTTKLASLQPLCDLRTAAEIENSKQKEWPRD